MSAFSVVGLSILFSGLVVLIVVRSNDPSARLVRSARAKSRAVIERHMETLLRRRSALVVVDDYGVVDGSRWNREVQHFIDHVIRPNLTDAEARAVADEGQLSGFFQVEIEDRVREHGTGEPRVEPVRSMTPLEFERHCAQELTRLGWQASTTQISGDQGADVIARKNGITIVLQCKLFRSPVGNKAVQEVNAAKAHYRADYAAVVSNAQFTRSAMDLSRTTGVRLLHYSQLTDMDALAE